MSPLILMATAGLGIALLLFLVLKYKFQPFVALMLVSIMVALIAGVKPADLVATIEGGMGKTLGHIAIIIALGAMIGRIIELSGGAEALAKTLIERFGNRRTPLALTIAGFIIGVPVFFEVGVIILMPLAYGVARRARKPLLMFALPMCAALLTGIPDPLQALARELSQAVRVLCFDELFVNDIGDAIILGRLFQVMFEHGVVVVCTSNQPPDQLYAGGFNRERFLPGIVAIKQHMQVVAVDGGEDHRLHPGVEVQRYWVNQADALAAVFQALSDVPASGGGAISVGHRSIMTVQASDTVLWCRYADLCEQPLAAMDFMLLCDRFKAILLGEVPNLSAQQRPGRIARGTEDAAMRVRRGIANCRSCRCTTIACVASLPWWMSAMTARCRCSLRRRCRWSVSIPKVIWRFRFDGR